MSVPAQVPISGPYIANGVTTQFAYKFYLLFATDMQVFVGGLKKTLNTDYTVTGVGNSQGGNVVFTTAPASGLEVLIKRATPYTRQTDYADNGDLLADVVNDDFDRIWLALQEINASFSSSISKPVGGNWDAQGLRLTGLADGSQPQDAVTYNQLFTVNGSAGQSATAAADSATAAKNSENNAATSQQAAAGSAGAASVSASNSSDSANLAQKWAANPVGAEVTAGKFSALHYASKASDSATSASNSAASASTSAGNASGSASAAAQSATNAKSDADRAQSANPDNQLKKASNLSDVADKAAAWANIAKFGTVAGTAVQGNDTRVVNAVQSTGAANITGSFLMTGGIYANSYKNDYGFRKTSDGSFLDQGRLRNLFAKCENNSGQRFEMDCFDTGADIQARIISFNGGDYNAMYAGVTGCGDSKKGPFAYVSSDRALKENITNSDKENAWLRLKQITTRIFDWKADKRRDRGFIAQELQEIDQIYAYVSPGSPIMGVSDRAIMADILDVLVSTKLELDELKAQIVEKK
ncbi:phage tail fiber protein [Pantoea ananatis]|uniref:phage tail fiber domain-containing protein n=1 Tax=Pantoea ananas TaxID=553 RepID=UPI001B309C60|nr:phage tail fiber protein [Pantoea ananatis]